MKTLHKPTTKWIISMILICITLLYTYGCNYYKVNNSPSTAIASIARISNVGTIHKSFFVNTANAVFSLSQIRVDSTSISGILSIPMIAPLYNDYRQTRYLKDEKNILNEVHIYLNTYDISQFLTNPDSAKTLGPAVIPYSSIGMVKIVEKDTGKTSASHFFGAMGIIAGVLVIISIIAVLLKSSCPYVYAFDGEGYIFEGEIFGGAIAKNLQREDYLPLPSLKSKDGLYKIRISNELKERQYTDLAQLIVVDHPEGKKVLLDKKGNPHSIENLQKPMSSNSFSGANLLNAVESKDELVFFLNDENYSTNGILLKFQKPSNTSSGKLVINAKNTLWFDYQFGLFLEMFGSSYDSWMEKQGKIKPEERYQKVLDNGFPLSVYMRSNGEWQLIEQLNTIGPLAYRDFVIPVDLRSHSGNDVEIKLQSGFMFWEVDQIGMDFSQDQNLKINYLYPVSAAGSGDRDWLASLTSMDENYMAQDTVGLVTEVIFRTPNLQEKNYERTSFLHTSGYYELIREFSGPPQLTELYKFKTPGYFSDFSRQNYLSALEKENTFASVKTLAE